jgi:hypothetical protein
MIGAIERLRRLLGMHISDDGEVDEKHKTWHEEGLEFDE